MVTRKPGSQFSGLTTVWTLDQYYYRRVVWWNLMIQWKRSITDFSIPMASKLWYRSLLNFISAYRSLLIYVCIVLIINEISIYEQILFTL